MPLAQLRYHALDPPKQLPFLAVSYLQPWGLMEVRSLDELREADERTLPFGPLGLGGKLKPQDAAEFQEHFRLLREFCDGSQ